MVTQTIARRDTVALEYPSLDRGSGRYIQNAEGVFDVAHTRRYFVQLTQQVDGYSEVTAELDLLVPQGIYLGRTERQAIEQHCRIHWPQQLRAEAWVPEVDGEF